MKKGNLLTLLLILGLAAGAAYGEYVLLGSDMSDAHWTRFAGDFLLIRPLTLLVMPLVFVSVVVGVTSIGNPSRLGLIGGATLTLFVTTMLIAATLGTVLATVLGPGDLPGEVRSSLIATAEKNFQAGGSAVETIAAAQREEQDTLTGAWTGLARQLVPTNLFSEMVQGRSLGVIVFAVLLGMALAMGGQTTQPAVRVFDALFAALMRIVGWVIWLTPLGVFLLVSWTVGRIGLKELAGPLGMYMLVVIGGLAIHGLIILPLIQLVLTGKNPYRFIWQMRRALLTAFGTASSTATLPITMESCLADGGCSKRATNFVVPLGATINRDGTALFEAVAIVFLFQLYGAPLTFSQLLVVVIATTLAAMSAPGIPSAALSTMLVVITAVNTSLTGDASKPLPLAAMGVIIGVDGILDMCRTTINVWGDAVGAKIMTRIAPDPPGGAA